MVAATSSTCSGSDVTSHGAGGSGTVDAAGAAGTLVDGGGLDVGLADALADPQPDLTCVESDAKAQDPTIDGGGCLCPPTKPPPFTACSPAVDCAHCGYGTCWADCLECATAGPVWLGGCTE